MRRLFSMLALLAAVGLAASASSAEGTGNWTVDVKKSALDGSETVSFATIADKGCALFILCDGKDTDVAFVMLRHFFTRGEQTMPYSVDGGPVQNIKVTTANGGAFITPRTNANRAQFINGALIDRDKLVVQLTPRQGKQELIFEVGGLREIITPHLHLCSGLTILDKP